MKIENIHLSPSGDNAARAAIDRCRFEADEIYLFHAYDPQCPADEALWGTFESRHSDGIKLYTCTDNLIDFIHRCRLPEPYRYCRLATRREICDYMTALALFETSRNPCG